MRLSDFILALVFSACYALIAKYDDLGKIVVSYEVLTENKNITQLYWKSKNDDSVLHLNKPIESHPKLNLVSYRIDASVEKITIVPIVTEDMFSLNNINIYRPGLIISVPSLSRQSISLLDATDENNHQQIDNDLFEYKSSSANPLFTFSTPSETIYIKYFILNFLTLSLIFFCSQLIYNKFSDQNHKTLLESSPIYIYILLLLPFLFLIAKLSSEFNNPYTNLEFISQFTLISYLVYLTIGILTKFKSNVVPITIMAILVYSLLPDVSYKLGIVDRKPYSNVYTPIYHWRLDSSPQINLSQSGYLYRNDFIKIRNIIAPGSSFISDQATSYYALSFLPIYSAIAKPHHGGSGNDDSSPFVSYEFQKYLCDSTKFFGNKTIEEFIKDKLFLHKKQNWPNLKYILLNKDTQNRFVRWQCLTARNGNTVNKVNTISKLIYQGEHIDLYEIINS